MPLNHLKAHDLLHDGSENRKQIFLKSWCHSFTTLKLIITAFFCFQSNIASVPTGFGKISIIWPDQFLFTNASQLYGSWDALMSLLSNEQIHEQNQSQVFIR